MIIMNSVLIGYTAEFNSQLVRDQSFDERQEPMPVVILGHICTVFFFLELVLRMVNMGADFWIKADGRCWNMFDLFLVLFSLAELAVMFSNTSQDLGGNRLKTIKMLRIVRVFRVFRFFRELSLVALMIIDSMRSLLWALVLMTIIIYVFAILNDGHVPGLDVERYFGSLYKTVYILVQCMMNGVSWGVVADTLHNLHPLVLGAFFFYLAFTILAVMNIITGVFVDNAVETAKTQRDWLVQKQLELREKYVVEMREIFLDLDEDASGTMTLEELTRGLKDPRVQSYFTALGLELHDTARLFNLIDDDGSGTPSQEHRHALSDPPDAQAGGSHHPVARR
mmetsp:Transcript_1028/g.4214  ORF Transcript_1028/g.4214 Transcript_1028/m.4214 type:complete len:338 (-) Transcript_1028:118-1131(-)